MFLLLTVEIGLTREFDSTRNGFTVKFDAPPDGWVSFVTWYWKPGKLMFSDTEDFYVEAVLEKEHFYCWIYKFDSISNVRHYKCTMSVSNEKGDEEIVHKVRTPLVWVLWVL